MITVLLHIEARALALFLACRTCLTVPQLSESFTEPTRPQGILIEVEDGILADTDSGTILYGKNVHQRHYLAGITKILTVLIAIERYELNDTITSSYDAVHDVESDSISAGHSVGDKITAREILYALLLRLANEVANALAEHCAKSREALARLMNERAVSLGCKESRSANPSGLNDEDYYTTAYGYSLIAMTTFKNPTSVESDSTIYYEPPSNNADAKSFAIYYGHRMSKKSPDPYYSSTIDGKIGYVMTAGNTLVICTEYDSLELTTVILNDHLIHYSDTKKLLDLGSTNFRAVSPEGTNNHHEKPQIDLGLVGRHKALLSLSGGKTITLLETVQLSGMAGTLSYELPSDASKNAVA